MYHISLMILSIIKILLTCPRKLDSGRKRWCWILYERYGSFSICRAQDQNLCYLRIWLRLGTKIIWYQIHGGVCCYNNYLNWITKRNERFRNDFFAWVKKDHQWCVDATRMKTWEITDIKMLGNHMNVFHFYANTPTRLMLDGIYIKKYLANFTIHSCKEWHILVFFIGVKFPSIDISCCLN